MVTHIVMFSWKAGVTQEQTETFHRELAAMASKVSSIGSIQHGPDLRFRDGNADYAMVETFKDRAAWDDYQADPLHESFIRDFVAPIMASRITIQF